MLYDQPRNVWKPVLARFTRALRSTRARSSERVLLAGARVATLLGIFALLGSLAGISTAFAVQAKPPTDWSFYINSSSTSKAYTLGCNQGHSDTTSGANSEVILAFGGQLSNNSGTEMTFGAGNISNGAIEAVAEAFSHGYTGCHNASTVLTLGIGTNNNISVTYTGGQPWANVVKAVNTSNASHGYEYDVIVEGANDIEPGFGGASAARSWAQGFASVPGYRYIDFGSADGCPASGSGNGSCNNGWTEDDEWYVSWGNPAADNPVPQIFYSAMAHQWATISLYGATHKGSAVYMAGPGDEHELDTSTLTSSQAWTDLWTDLNNNSATRQSMSYSLEIHHES